MLHTARPSSANMSKHEIMALKKLKSNPVIVILSADQGNATVILD